MIPCGQELTLLIDRDRVVLLAYEHCRRFGSTPAGHGFRTAPVTSVYHNYITEIMSVSQVLTKRRRLVQLPGLASQASPTGIPCFGVAMPDLSGRHSVRNVKRKFDPSMRLVRLVSSPARSLTMRVPMRVDVTPNPIDDTFGYRIPLDDQGR